MGNWALCVTLYVVEPYYIPLLRYYIMDEGTMNGTFLNGTRLSEQKETSER